MAEMDTSEDSEHVFQNHLSSYVMFLEIKDLHVDLATWQLLVAICPDCLLAATLFSDLRFIWSLHNLGEFYMSSRLIRMISFDDKLPILNMMPLPENSFLRFMRAW